MTNAQADYWREAYQECLKALFANGRVIGRLAAENNISEEHVAAGQAHDG